MEPKSKITLIITDRKGGTIKRSLIKKFVEKTYAKLGLEPAWDGKVAKKPIKIR